ncbi:MAG TPA: SRPBCC family protein [Rhizomicrobium sp.]|jgi:uncharacterized protein YndB with AHSA1/START domain
MTQTTAQVSKTIDATPHKVWSALTSPEKLKKFFFGAEIETDWKPGHSIRFRGEMKGKRYEDKGEIQTVEKDKVLSFSHWSPLSGTSDTKENYHVVTFDLEPEGSKTKVTLTQSNLDGTVKESDTKNREQFEKNWSAVLEGLDKVSTGA